MRFCKTAVILHQVASNPEMQAGLFKRFGENDVQMVQKFLDHPITGPTVSWNHDCHQPRRGSLVHGHGSAPVGK